MAEHHSGHARARERHGVLDRTRPGHGRGATTPPREQNEWVSGPEDLLHIARAADDELLHSNVVAWLLIADGRHRLGDRLLRDLLAEGWPGPVPDTLHALVEREVVRGPRRADIIVTMGPVTLAIENKMWSDESEMQCQDL